MDNNQPRVISVNIGPDRQGPKTPAERADLNQLGIVGDAHLGPGLRQVSLLDLSSVQAADYSPGSCGENLTVTGLDTRALSPLAMIHAGSALLEVTQLGAACTKAGCAAARGAAEKPLISRGIFTRVIRGGTIAAGDPIDSSQRVLHFSVIEISLAEQTTTQHTGQQVIEALKSLFSGERYALEFSTETLPPDPVILDRALEDKQARRCDAVFVLGADGIGPRDIAPETIVMRCSRLYPGVMETARAALGQQNPRALMNRGVAGAMGHSLVFSMPGDSAGLTPFLDCLLPGLTTMILALHGIDPFVTSEVR